MTRADELIRSRLEEGQQDYGYHVLWHSNDLDSVRGGGLVGQHEDGETPGRRELHFTKHEDHAREYEGEHTVTLRFPIGSAGKEGEHLNRCDDHWTTTKAIHQQHIEHRSKDGAWQKL